MDEDYSLSNRRFYQRLTAQIEQHFRPRNIRVFLLGFSLGACVVLGLVTYLANRVETDDASLSTETFGANMEIITLNCDIFFPNYDCKSWDDESHRTFIEWSDACEYREIRRLKRYIARHRIQWHHLFNSFVPIHYPAKFRQYPFITYYRLDRYYPFRYPNSILNHYYFLNPYYSIIVNQLIGYACDKTTHDAARDAAEFVDPRRNLIIRPPSMTSRIIR